jgi:hypothetical protein
VYAQLSGWLERVGTVGGMGTPPHTLGSVGRSVGILLYFVFVFTRRGLEPRLCSVRCTQPGFGWDSHPGASAYVLYGLNIERSV